MMIEIEYYSICFFYCSARALSIKFNHWILMNKEYSFTKKNTHTPKIFNENNNNRLSHLMDISCTKSQNVESYVIIFVCKTLEIICCQAIFIFNFYFHYLFVT